MTDTTADLYGAFGTRDVTLPRADLYFVRDWTGTPDDARAERIESLLARSLDADSPDWDALARADIDGWGADDTRG